MDARQRPRFAADELRASAGDTVFARGEAYHRNGRVEILSLEPDRVLALVTGSQDYRTQISGAGTHIDGECSCPAYDNWGFCKHMVATALTVNAMELDGETEGAGALARIREHLMGSSVEALAGMILKLAEHDAALFRRLDMAAALANEDSETLKPRLRKAIDSATKTGRNIDYWQVADWAAGVDQTLDAIADLAPAGHAGLARELADHAIGRIEQAIEEIDDSDGHCGELLVRTRNIHLSACQTAKPDPVALARDLFTREMEEDWDTFYGAVALYADVLGKDGLTEYRRLASQAWEKLPPRIAGGRLRDEFSSDYDRLTRMLDFFAEREDDPEARIALRAKDLSSPWHYLQLAEFCLAAGREEEGLRRAEEGLWVFEDGRPDERLVLFTVDLLLKAGRDQDASTHLWRVFERMPNLDTYRRLRKLDGPPARDRAMAFLKTQTPADGQARWYSPTDLLVRVLLEEKMIDAAWAAVRERGAAQELKLDLARASDATHAGEALKVYAERAEKLARLGGNEAYREAAQLIAHMATLRSAAAQTAYVTDIKERFRRKRNFMKLLG